QGISDIKLEDVQIVNKWGGSIKLIAKVSELENGKILPLVMPMIVPFDNLISRVDDVFNAVLVSGNGIDKTLFYGRGAGKLPTASAVLGDVIDSVKHDRTVFSQSWESVSDNSFVEDWHNYKAPVYFRVDTDVTDTVKFVKEMCPENCELVDAPNGQLCFITPVVSLTEADNLKEKLESAGAKVVSLIPVLK
ncbi:MAG: homoserine dehydrogenase, partial [Porcipelethomonas sp.]